jgi:hypothetical protein
MKWTRVQVLVQRFSSFLYHGRRGHLKINVAVDIRKKKIRTDIFKELHILKNP